MLRATTPTHVLNFPDVVSSTYSSIVLTYVQNKNVILEKRKSDMTIDNKTAAVTLTQEETNRFMEDIPVEIQVRVKTFSDTVLASAIFKLPVERVLNDGVL